MKRSGFTMVELIFVIIIIGILAAAAIPKFGDIKDRAKASTEIGLFSSLDSAIISAVEFDETNWHDVIIPQGRLDARYSAAQVYNTEVNLENKVLSSIVKKGENLKIVGAASTNGTDIVAWGTATDPGKDILFITGVASDAQTGINPPNVAGNDTLGKPDKNDLWVFNPNSFDINITSTATYPLYTTVVQIPSQSIGLLDVNGTAQLAPGGASTNIRDLTVVRSDTTAAAQTNDVLEIRD